MSPLMGQQTKGDYQQFEVRNGVVANVQGRMLQKMDALKKVLPDWEGKTVLDIGCDFGYWSFLAASQGAQVLGLDRGREVRGFGWVNLPAMNNLVAKENDLDATFMIYEAGVQWHDVGEYDVVLLMSLYHHIYHNCGAHEPIWYWLRQRNATVIWENPTELNDTVVQLNVHQSLHAGYTEHAIRTAAEKYFEIEYEGPALHEETRTVWQLTPKPVTTKTYKGIGMKGAGGASKAFVHADNRRIKELEYILNITPIPGSFNVGLERDFNWDAKYYRASIMDVVDRRAGIDSQWALRPVRLYPVKCNDQTAYAMRFEGENYPLDMVELISDKRLNADKVEIWQ